MTTPLTHRCCLLAVLILFFSSAAPGPALATRTPYDWAYVQLDYACQEKTQQLERFMTRMHDLAKTAATDETVTRFFEMNQQFHFLKQSQAAPVSLQKGIHQMRQHFNGYYIAQYFNFYDILFVNPDGSVFYSLRNEADNAVNLMDTPSIVGPLGTAISLKPKQEVFVDFYEYGPSAEPAAFFIEPIQKSGTFIGWIVLQLPINTLNSIFSATDDLGKTGETFLVNRQGLMLTESFFKGESTILNTRLDDRNINAKFNEKKGRRMVVDYRGETALSSFDVFAFSGTLWLVVAKIDKAEITTRHFIQHHKYYTDLLKNYYANAPLLTSGTTPHSVQNALRVDMDEFLKAKNGQALETWGVSTCTAVLAAVPEKFAYLAHISPKDRIYDQDKTNLLSQMTKKITSFDVYPCERQTVMFAIVATHLDSLDNILLHLIGDGFFLSQIRVFHNPNASMAALAYHYEKNQLSVVWHLNKERTQKMAQAFHDTQDTGRILESIMSLQQGNINKSSIRKAP